MRAQLERSARELREQMLTMAGERDDEPAAAAPEFAGDVADRGEQIARDRVRDAERRHDVAALTGIAAALERLAQGTYGVCSDCGTDIPMRRLRAQPAAGRCIDCQERHERVLRASPIH